MESSIESEPPSLSAFLEMLREYGSSCVIRVGDGSLDGELYIAEGQIVAASLGALTGQGALDEIMSLEGLHYELIAEPEAVAAAPLADETEPAAGDAPSVRLFFEEEELEVITRIHGEPDPAPVPALLVGEELFDLAPESTRAAAPVMLVVDELPDAEPQAQPIDSPKLAPRALEPEASADDSLFSEELDDAASEEVAGDERLLPEELAALAQLHAHGQVSGELELRARPGLLGESSSLLDARFGRDEWEQVDAAQIEAAPDRASLQALPHEAVSIAPPQRAAPGGAAAGRSAAAWLGFALLAPALFGAAFWSARPERRADAPASQANDRKLAVIRSTERDRPPELVEGAAPEAPQGALLPTILVSARIDEHGRVREAEVGSPRPELSAFEAQALEAVRGYRFRPALKAGAPSESVTRLALSFAPPRATRELLIKGSETLGAALAPAWARALERSQPDLRVRGQVLDVSAVFAGLLDGSAALAASSRPIGADELALADKLGLELRELVVGYDALAVIVHPESALRELDLETVARIFARRVTRWSELELPELAGDSEAPIRALGAPHDSEAYGLLCEQVLRRFGADAALGASLESFEAGEQIVAQVASDEHAIGYVSFGQLDTSVRALPLSLTAGAPPVTPERATIGDGSYPVARPLFLYLRADGGQDARALADLALSAEGQGLLEQHGLVPLRAPAPSALAAQTVSPALRKPELVHLYFRPDSSALPEGARDQLEPTARSLRMGARALVIANAEPGGDVVASRRLALRRANLIAGALAELSGGQAAIDVEVASADHPLAPHGAAERKRADRRVDVVLVRR